VLPPRRAAEAGSRSGPVALRPLPQIAALAPRLPGPDISFIQAGSAWCTRQSPGLQTIASIRAAYDTAVQTEPLGNVRDPDHKAYRARILCETMLGSPRAESKDFFDWLIKQYASGPDTPEGYTTRRVLQRTGRFLDGEVTQPLPPLPILSDRFVQEELARQDRLMADYNTARDICARLNFPFETFKHVINAESEFDAAAVNKDTDATGLAQFMRNTWLACILQLEQMPYGPQALAEIKRLDLLDMDEARRSIFRTGRFSFAVADPAMESLLCKARLDPTLNILIAIPMLAESQDYARHRLPCALNPGINWLLNILGPSTGVKMVLAAFAHPKGQVNHVLTPAIIRENSAVFGIPGHVFTARAMLEELNAISTRTVVPEMLAGAVSPMSPPPRTRVLLPRRPSRRTVIALAN
jgi:hypothetical protein